MVVALEVVPDVEIAEFGVVAEIAGCVLVLGDYHGRDRPLVVEIDLEGRPPAGGVHRVEILFHGIGIVDRDWGVIRIPIRSPGAGVGNARRRIALESILAVDVVDVAAAVLVIAHQPDRGVLGERNVHVAFECPAAAAVLPLVGFHVVGGRESGRIGLVGDDAQGAGQGTRPVQGALGSGQRLDARDVVHMDVERPGDGGHRQVVEVQAARRKESRVQTHVAVAAGNAAEKQLCLAWSVGPEAQARQELGVVVEAADLKLLEFFAAQHLQTDGDFLKVFRALLRGDHDFLERCRIGCIGRIGCVGHAAPRQ